MDIFRLADLQLQREHISSERADYISLLLIRAIKIRHYLDIQARNIKVARNRNK